MSGWGGERWGLDPWGGFALGPAPPLPGTAPPLISIPRELPPLVHGIRGPNGRVDYPEIIGDFRAGEVNGFDFLEGAVERDRALEQPDIYTDGAQWIVVDSESGEIVAGGDLFDPGISGGRAILRADGWGKRLQRQVQRYLVQNKRFSDWFESSSDPLHLKDPSGSGDPDDVDSIITVDTSGGRILFSVPEGTNVEEGMVNRVAFWAPGTRVTRLAFDWDQRFVNDRWTLRVHSTQGPDGELVHQLSDPLDALTGSVDIGIPAGDHDLVTIGLWRSGATGTSSGYFLRVRNVRVNGVAVGDLFTFADLVRDIAGRSGFAVSLAGASLNILPLDQVGESFASALDYGSLVEDQFWRVVGLRGYIPVIETVPWEDEVWELADPEFPIEPIPLPRYDRIDMPFRYPNASAIGYVTVRAAQSLPVPRSFGQVQLDQPGTVDAMTALGERLLAVLSRPRLAGQVSFTRAVVNGEFRTAHLFHGGSVYLPGQDVTCRVKSFERTGAGVIVTLDDRVAAYDRILARRARQLASRGVA